MFSALWFFINVRRYISFNYYYYYYYYYPFNVILIQMIKHMPTCINISSYFPWKYVLRINIQLKILRRMITTKEYANSECVAITGSRRVYIFLSGSVCADLIVSTFMHFERKLGHNFWMSTRPNNLAYSNTVGNSNKSVSILYSKFWIMHQMP